MAEESELQRNSPMDNPKAKTFENGWIVCRSQKRPGLLYDFNTLTGEAVWRDPDKTAQYTAIMDKNKVPFDCHEPTEPPMEPKSPCQHKKVTQSSSARNIYNKQIINNQYPAKQFAIAPYGNSTCAPYGLIDPNNGIGMNTMNATPTVWVAAPTTPQVLLPTVTSLNQVQTIYGGLENLQMQNSSLTLSNRFQVLNQLNTGSPIGLNMQNEGGSDRQRYNHQQPHNNVNSWHQMNHWKPVNNHFNRPADLRSKLSSRRRLDLNTKGHEDNVAEKQETNKKDASAIVTEDDLNPDDNDEWLEAHTDGEGRELNMDIESFWDLADSSASRDCCYIIPTTRVLLNHMRFLTSLLISDDRLRLLTPRDVVRTLRSAAFSDNGRLGDYASRARTFAIRQMRKFPDTLKDAPNIKSCLELIAPNIHVVRLVDEKDILNQESINDGTLTITELKQYLTRTSNRKPKTVSKLQNICENIKITVSNDELKPGCILQVQQLKDQIKDSPNTNNITEETTTVEAPRLDTDQTAVKEIEIQTDLTAPPGKQTANACVQTDFDFTIALSTERKTKPIKISQAINTADESCDKQTDYNFTLTEIRPKVVQISQTVDAAEPCNDNIATTVAPRKIRLKRQQSSTTINTEEKKSFKWRKRKSTALTSSVLPANVDQCHQSSSISTPTSSTSFVQQHDAMDYRHSDVSVTAKMVDGSSTSGVLSNSIDSDTVLKINKQEILNKSKTDESIVVYEVTSDLMQDRLIVRCEEWMSRFVQIMEEVLSQVLLLEPTFKDATLPPPWSFYESTVCIKRKFANEAIVVDASDKLAMFLLKINDDRGNIEARISPKDFMQMYTYGVNLINKLQSVLKYCEDLHIASQNLSKLLCDIREPNLDESYDLETFNDESIITSPNISEAVTDISTIVSGRPENSPPVNNVYPKNKDKPISCNNSPARYSLRSSRSHSEQKKKQDEGENDAAVQNKEYTLFSSLGLQKRDFKVDKCFSKTIPNSPKDQPSSPLKQTHDIASDNIHNGKENDDAKPQPKIIRNFSVCPEFEKRLKGIYCSNTDIDHADVDHAEVENNYAIDNDATNDYVEDDYVEHAYVADDYIAEDVRVEDDVDFAEDDFTNHEPYNYDNDYGGMLGTTKMDVDPSYENTQSCHLNANSILKQVVRKITHEYRRWLSDLRKFCEVTNANITSSDYHQHPYQANVMENITKVAEHANNVCHRLKCILVRDPRETSNKFREMIKSYGILDFDISDTQMAEYRVLIEKYLELAERLLTCVTRLAEAVKVK